MSTLFDFISKTRKRGLFWWCKYYYNEFLTAIYQRKIEKDDSWKRIKLKSSVIPEGWSKENAFKFLEKEYQGRIMKAYKK